MALRTPPSWLQGSSHPAENDRLTNQTWWSTSGVINTSDLAVTAQAIPDLTVNVAAGWAAIVGNYQTNMGVYTCYNDATTILTISTPSATLARIDLIVITINDSYYSGASNSVAFSVIAGTPAASPTVPAVPTNSIALAQIAVGAAVTTITSANITNRRVRATSPSQTAWINAQTGTTYTPVISDGVAIITMTNAAANTVSIPTNASVAFPIGTQITIAQTGAGQTTINAVTSGTTTILAAAGAPAAPKCRAQYSSATCIKTATDTWLVFGDIA